MRTPPWILRRAVIAPLMPVGFLLALAALPFVGLATVASALVQKLRGHRPRSRAVRVTAFALVYLFAETACLLAALLLWVAFGFGLALQAPRSVAAHLRLGRMFLGFLMFWARRLFGFRLLVEDPAERRGDVKALDGRAPVVVLARHAGPGASFVLIDLLLRRHRRHPRVVLAEELRLDPSIDVLLTRLGAAFIRRGSGEEAVEAVSQVAASLAEGDAMVLYPEGADWSPLRQVKAVAKLRRRGLLREARDAVRMPHVLPPHPAGVLAALQAARGCDLVVFTHTGHDHLLDLASTWAALPLDVPLRMAWWRIPADSVPRDDEVSDWLHETWSGIDGWIEEQAALARES